MVVRMGGFTIQGVGALDPTQKLLAPGIGERKASPLSFRPLRSGPSLPATGLRFTTVEASIY
uniref:Uncharacterized protein n=1 Tax=Oryza sativa subsp. japonica TaxID=39947 RepID=Q6K483_ORYSJ|nr:hypothetical protein [Oryza sativa Japonica Group]